MRKFIVQQWVTVDNIAAEEDGGMTLIEVETDDKEFHLTMMDGSKWFVNLPTKLNDRNQIPVTWM